jgi:hypothetical protein
VNLVLQSDQSHRDAARSPYFDQVLPPPKHAAIEMKRRFRWPGRKSGDSGATNTPNAPQEVRDAGASPQHTTAPLPERPQPRASADRSSSTPSLDHLSAARSQSLPSSTTNANRTASTSAPQNVQHSTSQDGTLSGANASKKDYWRLAVDQLQEEDASVADQIKGVQQAAAAAGNADFTAQLLHTTQQGQQELEFKRWKITTGSREIVLRDQFDRLKKAVTLFKDVGNAAGSIDPLHAGLPLAGFCVLMQVGSINPMLVLRRC